MFRGTHERMQRHQQPPIDPRQQMIEDAVELLYHATELGRPIPAEIRAPLLAAQAVARTGVTVEPAAEALLLDAYTKLADLMRPVTATTLRASERRFGRRPWWSRLFTRRKLAEGQIISIHFGLIAMLIFALLVGGEWMRAFVAGLADAQRNLDQVETDLRSYGIDPSSFEANQSTVSDTLPSAVAPIVPGSRQQALITQWGRLQEKVTADYQSLYDWFSFSRIATDAQGKPTVRYHYVFGHLAVQDAVAAVGIVVGGFLLPVLYAALGTCVYLLRTMYTRMVERSFDPTDAGQFPLRIFLGTLSGLTLQWIVANGSTPVPGGLTPAILVFLAGYSVELLFAILDRLLGSAKEMFKSAPAPSPAPAHPTPQPAP
ncbi:MAG TPA: hypothetical protein VMW17_14570 [Candidatus Binatia bacterium]|nr:hypothetical protein [Candidatus Binatia bacterium]